MSSARISHWLKWRSFVEDLVTFDLYGVSAPGRRRAAFELLAKVRGMPFAVSDLLGDPRAPTLLLSREPWSRVLSRKAELSAEFGGLQVFQSGYDPTSPRALKFCPKHELYHAGIGCPVGRDVHEP